MRCTPRQRLEVAEVAEVAEAQHTAELSEVAEVAEVAEVCYTHCHTFHVCYMLHTCNATCFLRMVYDLCRQC